MRYRSILIRGAGWLTTILSGATILSTLPTAAAGDAFEAAGDKGVNGEADERQEAYALDQLLTTQRVRAYEENGEDGRPDQSASVGDNLVWFAGHPLVTDIVVGKVLSAQPEVRHDAFVVTRCVLSVEETLKGAGAQQVEFLSWGGTSAGHSSYTAHMPRCQQGERVVALLGWEGSERIVVGSADYLAVLDEVDGRPRPWGYAVRQFLQSTLSGRPQ
jgi:hypothetical protein